MELEFEYRQRLLQRSERSIELPLVDAETAEQKTRVFEEVCGILSYARRQVRKGYKADSWSEAAVAEVHRRVTLDWFIGVSPLLQYHFPFGQWSRLQVLATSLYRDGHEHRLG